MLVFMIKRILEHSVVVRIRRDLNFRIKLKD